VLTTDWPRPIWPFVCIALQCHCHCRVNCHVHKQYRAVLDRSRDVVFAVLDYLLSCQWCGVTLICWSQSTKLHYAGPG